MLKTDIVFPNVKFSEYEDRLFTLFEKGQFKKPQLWKTLIRQFKKKTDAKHYTWKGEFWGKLMRSACLCYSYNKDKKLYKILSNTVNDIIAVIEKNGRATAYSDKREFLGWDMWAKKYVILGLTFFYDICVDEAQKLKIKNALIKHTDFIMDHVNEGKMLISETSGLWGGANSFSILQAIVKVYKITLDKKYLDYAKWLIDTQDFEGMNFFKTSLEKKELPPYRYPVIKAYELISCYEGLLEYYEVTKNPEHLQSCVNYANGILETDFTILGGAGCQHELFDNATRRQVLYDPSIEKQETCVTVTLMKFLYNLFINTKDVVYLDAIEKMFYNLYIGCLNFDYKKNKFPMVLSYSPTCHDPRWKRVGGKMDISLTQSFGCCISIAGAGLGIFEKTTAIYLEDCLYINIPTDAKYSFETESGKIDFTISGDYLNTGKFEIQFSKMNTACKQIKIRKPNWANDCAKVYQGTHFYEEGGFIVIDAPFLQNLNVAVEFDMGIKFLKSQDFNPDIDYKTAITKGPFVLCMNDDKLNQVFKFDTSCDCETGIDQNGRVYYDVKLLDGTARFNRYCDCGKDKIDKQMTNIWFKNR